MLGLSVVSVECCHPPVGLQLLAAVPPQPLSTQLPVFSTDPSLPTAAVHHFSALLCEKT